MMADKISEPCGTQTADMNDWRRSLRSPSPSGLRSGHTLRSRTPSPVRSKSARESRSLRKRSPSPNKDTNGPYSSAFTLKSNMKKGTVANGLRKSLGNSLTTDLSMSGKLNKSAGQLANIEAEYIKNLQQQIYFLELESNYLREQAKKATDMHPTMAHEAERMLAKLRDMQNEIDKQEMELKRKDSSIGIHSSEKQRLEEQLRLATESQQRDKRLLMDELVTMKKEKDMRDREITHKDEQLLDAKTEVDKGVLAMKNAELKINTLKAQLEQRIEQHNLTQLSLEEKRAELLTMSVSLRETEERYLASTVTIQDQLTQDLRDEIRMLHQKVKEAELSSEKDRFLRDKVTEDMNNLVKENSILTQQMMELTKQLEREKDLRGSTDDRHTKSISELVTIRDRESQAVHENDRLRDELRQEQDRARQYLEQLTNEETRSKKSDLHSNTLHSRLVEHEGMKSALEGENAQLRKDKTLLVDHVAELQRKMEDKDRDILMLRSSMDEMQTRVRAVDMQKSLDMNQQSQKWEEFSRLADSMKSLSMSMIVNGNSNNQSSASPRGVPQQY